MLNCPHKVCWVVGLKVLIEGTTRGIQGQSDDGTTNAGTPGSLVVKTFARHHSLYVYPRAGCQQFSLVSSFALYYIAKSSQGFLPFHVVQNSTFQLNKPTNG